MKTAALIAVSALGGALLTGTVLMVFSMLEPQYQTVIPGTMQVSEWAPVQDGRMVQYVDGVPGAALPFPMPAPMANAVARRSAGLFNLAGFVVLLVALALAARARPRTESHPMASLITRLFALSIVPAAGVMMFAFADNASSEEVLVAGIATAGGVFAVLLIGCLLMSLTGRPLKTAAGSAATPEAGELVQELHRIAQNMEERVESLETILLEQRRSRMSNR